MAQNLRDGSFGATHAFRPINPGKRTRDALRRAVRPLFEGLEQRRMLSITADPGGPYTVNEGSGVAISGANSTPNNGETITQYRWDLNYNPALGFRTNITGQAFTLNSADGAATRTIALRVTDSGGATHTTTTTVTTDNVAPTLTLTGSSTAQEGQDYSLSWSASDPGNDTITGWQVNWGDGVTNTYAANVTSATRKYSIDDSYTITLTATDEDGSYTQTKAVTVSNLAPTVTASAASSVNEASTWTLNFATPNRPDTIDGWLIVWGDGTIDFRVPEDAVATHTYQDNNTYTVSISAIEPDGGTGDTDVEVTVNNVDPTASVTGTPGGATAEGTGITFGSTASDVSNLDTLTRAWSVFKDGQAYSLPGGTTTNASSFTFTPRDNGSYTARLVVTDDDGGSVTVNTSAFTVTNVNPTASITGEPGSSINEGTEVNLTATPSDAGEDDSFSYAWTVTRGGDPIALPEGTTTNASAFSFTPNDNGTYLATVVVTDDDGGTVTVSSTAITVDNVDPSVSLNADPQNGTIEGDSQSFSTSVTDAGSGDSFTYAWSVTKDGNPLTLPGGTSTTDPSFVFTPLDNGDYVVTVVVTDDDGATDSATSSTLTITNFNPIAQATGDTEAGEGETVGVTVEAIDASPEDTLSYSWSVTRNGQAFNLPGGTITDGVAFSYIPTDEGTYVATVVVTDDDGGAVTVSAADLVVSNVDPSVDVAGTPSGSVNEGQARGFTSTVSDPGTGDVLTYGWTVRRNGSPYVLPGGTVLTNSTFSFTPRDDGSYIVRLTVEDDDGGSTTFNTDAFQVVNVDPTANIAGTPGAAIDEGDGVSLTASASDAGTDDTFTYAWSVTKNGSAFALPGGTTINAAGFSFTPTDNGTYVATVVVTDDDGGAVSVNTTDISVDNVNPTASVAGEPGSAIDEGAGVTLTATPADAGSADTFTYSWSVTRDGNPFTLPGGATTNAASFSFIPTDNGSYVATVVVTDDDGGTVSVDSTSITVNNVAPTGNVTGEPGQAAEGTAINLTAVPSDAGSADTFSYAWTVTKDGNPFTLPGGTTTNAAGFSFTPDDEGDFVATVVITDDDGDDVTVSSDTLAAQNVAPSAGLAGTPAGDADEGTQINFTSAAADAGVTDSISYLWSVSKGGSAYSLPGGTVTNTSTFDFTPRDNGTYTVSLVVTDNDGGSTTVDSGAITVVNVDPVGTVAGEPGSAIDEGTAVNLTVTAADAAEDDTLSYQWSVTKNGSAFTLPGGTTVDDTSFGFTPTDNGTYLATVVITDDDGGTVSVASTSISVSNVDPTASLSGTPGAAIDEGDEVTITATPADAGSGDTFTYAWSVTRDGNPFSLPGDVETDNASFSFTPDDNGAYVVSVTVTDDDGGDVTVSSSSITVDNVAPTASVTGETQEVEGSAIGATVAPLDAGSADTFSYSWSVTRNGSAFSLPGGTVVDGQAFSYIPTDEGTYVASVVVTDDDGDSVTADSAAVTVTNLAPSVSIGGAPSGPIAEGTSASFTTSVTDPGAEDTVGSYLWSVTKNGSAFTLPGGTTVNASTFSFTPTDNGTYVASVVVTDNDGASTTQQTSGITVTNANPAGSITGEPGSAINEGASVSLTASAADPGSADTHTFAWSVTRNGAPFTLPGGTVTNASGFTFTPTDNGTFVASVLVADDDGGSVTVNSTSITVNNVNPTASISGAPGSAIGEGTGVSLSASASDAGTNDTLTYAWSVTRNGASFTLPGGTTTNATTFSFTPNDEGTYVATVLVTDDDGGSVTQSTSSLTVDNVAPTATVAGYPVGSISEGAGVSLSATGADAGSADTISYAWTVTKGGDTVDSGTGSTFSFTPDDQGSYVVRLAVTDNDGGSTTLSDQTVTVTNVAPTPDISNAPSSSDEGTEVSVSASATDPSDADATAGFSFAWTVQAGDEIVFTGDSADFSFTPTDDGEYLITLTATDKDGGEQSTSATVEVDNVAPTPEVTGAPSESVNEGDSVVLTASATDPGAADTITGIDFAWSVRVGEEVFATGSGDEFEFVPDDNGEYEVTLTATDKDGGSSTSGVTVTADNVNPADLAISGAPTGSIGEGAAVSVTGSATDAGSADDISFNWAVRRTGSNTVLFSGNESSFGFTPTDNGAYVLTMDATDDDGGTTSLQRNITVTNVAPTVTLTAPTVTQVRGRTSSFSASLVDAGTADTHTVSWNWGDGSTDNFNSADQGALNPTHVFAASGTYSVSVTITDDDGGATTRSGNVTVRAAAMQVDPFDSARTALVVAGTPSADVIRFTLNSNNRVRVNINGEFLEGSFNPTGRIVAYGDGGSNNISLRGVNLPALFIGGSGRDTFSGGSGNDLFVGRRGNDALLGFGGRDILIGGADTDALDGGEGEDLLLGDNTTHAESLASLFDIFREWNRDTSFISRVRNLRGVTNTGLNGSTIFNDSTVISDGRGDVLVGGAGRDWFLGTDPDVLADFRFGTDEATDLTA